MNSRAVLYSTGRNDECRTPAYAVRVGRQKRQKMTIREMFQTYLPLRVSVRNKVEDQRYADYWSAKFGGLELDELTPLDLEKWRVERLQKVKPSTVNRALEYLKAFYQLAVRDGHGQSNPVIKVALLEENNMRTRFLSEIEEERLDREMAPAAPGQALGHWKTEDLRGVGFAAQDVGGDDQTRGHLETAAGKEVALTDNVQFSQVEGGGRRWAGNPTGPAVVSGGACH